MSTAAPGPAAQNMPHEERKVLAGTLVGTTIEWYDFFIYAQAAGLVLSAQYFGPLAADSPRSEEHTSELQSRGHLVCRLLLEKKNQPLPANPRRTSANRDSTRPRTRLAAG